MCFSYAVNFDKEALQSRLQLEDLILPDEKDTKVAKGFFVSGFTWPKLPVIRQHEGCFSLESLQWGLIPTWCKGQDQAMEMRKLGLNAKGETVNTKPMFRNAFSQGRCVVPAAGFFEWREVNRKKYPYFIHSKLGDALLLAGISDCWTDRETGEEFETYSIVTSAANSLLSMIHNTKLRMPLILTDKEAMIWMLGSNDDAKLLVKPCDDDLLDAYTVSKIVSNAGSNRDAEESQERYRYPELEVNTLF